jgi:hypothetical protein
VVVTLRDLFDTPLFQTKLTKKFVKNPYKTYQKNRQAHKETLQKLKKKNPYLFDTLVSNKTHQKNYQKPIQNSPEKSSSTEINIKKINKYKSLPV